MKMKKIMKEWTVDSTWGKIAMVSWGDPAKPPVLLMHGYMDSAATFIILVEQLPATHYYVAFDMPGHGKSDPFPPGILVSHLDIVETLRLVVEYMEWNEFAYISHSMGFFIGVFYNHLFPNKITKMVHIDPAPTISSYNYLINEPTYFHQNMYDAYYSSYERWNAGSSKRWTLDEIINIFVKERSLNKEQAEIIISRSLVPVGHGRYKLSWEPRMKKIVPMPSSDETLYTVITQHAPPTLIVEASEDSSIPRGRQYAASLLEKCRLMVPNFSAVTVTGGHDVHITNPERVVPYVEGFLKSDIGVSSLKSKI